MVEKELTTSQLFVKRCWRNKVQHKKYMRTNCAENFEYLFDFALCLLT